MDDYVSDLLTRKCAKDYYRTILSTVALWSSQPILPRVKYFASTWQSSSALLPPVLE